MKKQLRTYPRKWELFGVGVERLLVPGGWVVRSWCFGAMGITFVPDPKHEWILEEK